MRSILISLPHLGKLSEELDDLIGILTGFNNLTPLVLCTSLYSEPRIVKRLTAALPALQHVGKDQAVVIDRNHHGLYAGHHLASTTDDTESGNASSVGALSLWSPLEILVVDQS